MFHFNYWLTVVLLQSCILSNKSAAIVEVEDFNLLELPSVAVGAVLSFLPTRSLAACACTSKELKRMSNYEREDRYKKIMKGRCKNTIEHKKSIWGMVFSSDSKSLITKGYDATKVCRLETGIEKTIVEGKVCAIAVSPDSHNVVASCNNNVYFYNVVERTEMVIKDVGDIRKMVFTPSSQSLVMTPNMDATMLYNLESNATTTIFEGYLYPDFIEISPDGENIVQADNISTRLCSGSKYENQAIIAKWSHNPNATFSFDSRYLAHSQEFKQVEIYDIENPKDSWSIGNSQKYKVDKIFFSPRGRYLAALSLDGSVLYDMNNKTECKSLPNRYFDLGEFSSDDRYLSLVSGKTLYTIDLLKGEEFAKTLEHEESIKSIAFIDDSKRLLTITSDQTITDYEISSGTAKTILEKKPESGDIATKFQISPNGKYVAFALANNKKRKFKAEVYKVENLRKRRCSDGCFVSPLKKLAEKG